ncbi:hypothetical protein G6O67_004339 [Ophiocordyceps sinensis]|uniref:Uncharacterized protein n=1 Tax=Ophiocordyceps sinensis TaxID=72228 RepID=A0A8H4LYF1_9HYPO|nr:hypothetical protein G6O67_004339 [Ophiocordyceps sinensis]
MTNSTPVPAPSRPATRPLRLPHEACRAPTARSPAACRTVPLRAGQRPDRPDRHRTQAASPKQAPPCAARVDSRDGRGTRELAPGHSGPDHRG